MNPEDYKFITAIVNDQKPARSVLAGIIIESLSQSLVVHQGVCSFAKKKTGMQIAFNVPVFYAGIARQSLIKSIIAIENE